MVIDGRFFLFGRLRETLDGEPVLGLTEIQGDVMTRVAEKEYLIKLER